jgi:hypothetical protein
MQQGLRDDDQKKPRPVLVEKKREGAMELGEAERDRGRDHHRHLRTRS